MLVVLDQHAQYDFYSASLLQNLSYTQGADPGFQVRGDALKIIGVFCVKNHDFTPTNLICSNFRGGGGPSPLDPHLDIYYHQNIYLLNSNFLTNVTIFSLY